MTPRKRTLALATILVVATAIVTATLVVRSPGGRSLSSSASSRPPTSTTEPPTTLPTTTLPTTTLPTTATTVDPGSLPQTEAFPTSSDPAFTARMAALWNGVVSGSAQPALPAFFPESAYVTLKTEPDAAGDYTGRLLAEYADDLAAAHALLGTSAAAATLVGVDVDQSYGHWIPPGTCYNGVGYFEVPNARVVYSVDGQTRSFGIASMISWRGEWYVIHLGSVLRSGAGGQVDDPEIGPGVPAPSSTC